MDIDKIKELDVLLSSKTDEMVKVLVKVKDGMPDEVVIGEIHHLSDTFNMRVLVLKNVRLKQAFTTYNIALNVIDDIQFLGEEETSIKKAAT